MKRRPHQECIQVYADQESNTCDQLGNQQQGLGKYYEYNEFNQLLRVRDNGPTGPILEEYVYDHEGNRLKKSEPQLNQTTYYFSDNYIRVVNTTGTYEYVYYYDGDTLVAREDPNNKKFFYHPDILGSTDLITNESGDVAEETTYEPHGEVIEGGQTSEFLYTSKELDDQTGLYYFGARYYDPFFMHWIQPDETVTDVYNPQDLNRYAYVRNNPYKYVDPDGKKAELVTRGLNLYNPFNLFVSPVGYTLAQSPQLFTHSYFDISPDNPQDFSGVKNFQLGASKQNGILQPRVNQETSSTNVIEYSRVTLQTPKGMTDTQFINALYSEANKIGQAQIPYKAFPKVQEGTANSNVFASTLIQNTGSSLPAGTSYRDLHPSYTKSPGLGQVYSTSAAQQRSQSQTNQNKASRPRQSAFRNFFNKIRSGFRRSR